MKKSSEIYSLIALAFIALMPLHICIHEPFYLEDIVAPFIATSLALRGNFKRYFSGIPLALCVFLGTMLISALSHFLFGNENCYRLCILVYMSGLYFFFHDVPIPQIWLLRTGCAMYALFFIGWLPEVFRIFWAGIPETGLCFMSDNVNGTSLGFLARRYAFTFGNPNLLGAFYALPTAMILLPLRNNFRTFGLKKQFAIVCAIFICFFPLFHTFSKHAIMTAALFAGFIAEQFGKTRWSRIAASGAFVSIIVLLVICELTVLFAVFPIKSTSPFINTVNSPYYIHQNSYAQMTLHTARGALLGHTPDEIKELYPQFVNKTEAARTLEQYNALHLLEMYSTYLDPHNEYLSISSKYGIIPIIALLIFMALLMKQLLPHSTMAACFILAMLSSCLWDDLLSKRWVWVTLAMVAGSGNPTQDPGRSE